jgi:tetrahydromethanopterin S-methyltransferase subunit G
VDAAYRRPPPPLAEKSKRRGVTPTLLTTGLAILLAAGASAFYIPQVKSTLARYGGPLNATFDLARSETAAGFASAASALKTPLEAISGSGAREEERAAARDLSAALTQVTIRLDQIERDYAARLDKLGERIDQTSAYRVPDMVQRLDKLEQKAAAPAASVSEVADLVARLDRVEKKAAVAPEPASASSDITARLDKVERRAAIAVAPSELTAVTTRLDKLEKRLSVAAASSPLPIQPAAPRPATLLARADPTPPNDVPKPSENSKPLLRSFSIEDVRDGVAVVDTREGPQQVGPGDLIPGAGRVLRIERRNGEWFVVTSVGIIASDPGAY